MAILTDSDRISVWATVMRDASAEQVVLAGVTKADLRAAINGIDDWVDSNATSFNTAIPQPARSALTPKQKAQLLVYVVRRRFEVA